MVNPNHRPPKAMFYFIYKIADGMIDERLGGYLKKIDADRYAARYQKESDDKGEPVKFVVRYEDKYATS